MNPQMLTLLRESRGLSQGMLAKRSGIPQPTLSKAENGFSELDADRLDQVAAALEYPSNVLLWSDDVYGFGNAVFHHRKQQSMTQTALRQVHATVNLTRMRTARLVRGVDVDVRFCIPSIEADEMGGAREVARAVRAMWLLPMGPVRNMIRTLEHAGAIVVRTSMASPRISAISTATNDAPPIFLLNVGQSADRERWSLAHELGHLVMHVLPTISTDAEREADEFASEFLMPANEIRSHLSNLDLPKAAQLKAAWKVSIAAIIRAAHDLGKITDARYKSLNVRISQLGWRKSEPVDIAREEPTVLQAVLDVHRREHGYSIRELASLVGLSTREFEAIYGVSEPQAVRPQSNRDGIRLVT